MHLCYFGVFIVICHAQLTQAIAQCVRPTYSEYGHHLSGHVITTSKTFSITECVMFCLNESRCKSLNFRLKDKSCDLNSANKRTHPRDFGPKEGSVYMNKDDEFKSCSEILKKLPHAESDYYWITIGNRDAQVYCDMEKHGGGWTLAVSISSKNNDHLQNAANNCLNSVLCVPFTHKNQGRKLSDSDIHEVAKEEGTFRVDVLQSDGTFLHTVFYRIPSGQNKFNSTCHQGNCPRIIISHSYPNGWESSSCTGIEKGYLIAPSDYWVFDGHDNSECGGQQWSSSQYGNRKRALYGYTIGGNRGIYNNYAGMMYVK
nr:uncharacterized protein LOC131782859 [Pocillopora verrucosa]XP_058955576.1 uncharacterized protein LOC131782859 [Pocillopora verrucosa]XP_058955577.1 uncharacterized protein LOC131782859 [Pocillopora verrucosa]XP_058955578.1 uncharacterized protein LOC131782859 [Pocillopora verrucosa]